MPNLGCHDLLPIHTCPQSSALSTSTRSEQSLQRSISLHCAIHPPPQLHPLSFKQWKMRYTKNSVETNFGCHSDGGSPPLAQDPPALEYSAQILCEERSCSRNLNCSQPQLRYSLAGIQNIPSKLTILARSVCVGR